MGIHNIDIRIIIENTISVWQWSEKISNGMMTLIRCKTEYHVKDTWEIIHVLYQGQSASGNLMPNKYKEQRTPFIEQKFDN